MPIRGSSLMSSTAPLPLSSAPRDSTSTVHDEADVTDTAAPSTGSAPLTGRRGWLALGLLFLIGALVYLPALRSPFLLDDYLHASMIDGTFPARRGPFDLYNF